MSDPRPSPLEQKLITVASGKGGVGKTVFAVTLAHILARSGRKVLLFDGDLGLANVDIQLGLMPHHDIGDVICGAMDLEAAVISYPDAMNHKGRLDIIAGRSGSGALNALNAERLIGLRSGLTALCSRYDHVILDLSAGVDKSVLTLMDHGGAVLVVLTPDPTSLTDAYALIKLAYMRNPHTDIRVVVNLARSRRDGEQAFAALRKACEGFLGFTPQLAGILEREEKVTDSIRHQMPVLSRHPQAGFIRGIGEVAKQFPQRMRALAG